MAHKEFNRPDEIAMRRILDENRGTIAEIALRFAWNLGLTREEMHNLKWSDISLSEKKVYLPNREVPLPEEDALCLEKRSMTDRGRASEYIMTSDRNHTHMAPQSISRVVRIALDAGGLHDITNVDLRQDYVIRMLEKYDWPHVARVSGIAISTLYTNYGEYFANERGAKEEDTIKGKVEPFELWRIIDAEGVSPSGLALWMSWKLEMNLQEITELTWDQVDLKKGIIQIERKKVRLSSEFLEKLKTVRMERAADSDPHVLLTPRSGRPFELARLSRVMRTALIRGGLEGSLQDILNEEKRKTGDELVLEYVERNGPVTRKQLSEHLSLTKSQFYNRVERLIARGELIRVGQKLYRPGTVVPPEEHYEVIRAHLETMGGAYRGELAELLHIDGNQCGVILRGLIKEGKLVRTGQMYTLAD